MTRSNEKVTKEDKVTGNLKIKPVKSCKRKQSENSSGTRLKKKRSETKSAEEFGWCGFLEQQVNQEFRNIFEDEMDRVDEKIFSEVLLTFSKPGRGAKQGDVRMPDDKIFSYPEIRKMAMEIKEGDRELEILLTINFLQYLLFIWGSELNSREIKEKKSLRGMKSTILYLQTKESIQLLVMELRKKILIENVEDFLAAIVKNLLQGNYSMVSDFWFHATVQHIPCPIEVVIVGTDGSIEKEETRPGNIDIDVNRRNSNKSMIALKRLMVKCQQFYPTVPPFHVEGKS